VPAAAYWRPEAAGARQGAAIRCELCPHACLIAEGRSGICKVRRNEGGSMALPYFGFISSLAMDPIEKKPLYHFLPGSSVFSAGFVGCNMRCPFCQNWRISQEIPVEVERLGPGELAEAARRSGAPSIAYTYSEPTVHFEFVLAAMSAARKLGLKNVLVTNGCLEPGPARELLELTDAANVDLKTWSDEGYRKTLGGEKESVLEFIRIAASLCHVEATTLVVPGLSDSVEGMRSIAGFLAELSEDIPLHLSAYHPDWKHDAPPTSLKSLALLEEAALSRLRFVYIGNVHGGSSDTVCPACGATAVARRGYMVDAGALAVAGSAVSCAACGKPLPIIVQTRSPA
jgi:pyruvate formate lyase activating enzyme